MPLQRVITDFGADVSFEDAVKKIKEHYGVTLPVSAARAITENHAERILKDIDAIQVINETDITPDKIIAEIDGSMIPIVSMQGETKEDKRKTRKTEWCEARLALARAHGSRSTFFSAMIGTVEEAGAQLFKVVKSVGRGSHSLIHGIADGAVWIYDQFDKQFGSNGHFLIDFYHASEYLSAAAVCFDSVSPTKWLHEQQALLKENKIDSVLKTLEGHINKTDQKSHDCGAIKCYRYMENRSGQFKYKDALDQDLPIGSGEVESAHRSIIQKRLKIPGAWWLKKNANRMLALRTIRANGYWEKCWPRNSAMELVY